MQLQSHEVFSKEVALLRDHGDKLSIDPAVVNGEAPFR